MSDDNKEFADDSRSEQPKQIEHSDKAITYPHGKVDLTASKEDGDDELGAGGFPGEEVERFEELARFIGSSWSGMLPPPDEFKSYPEWVQEKMVAWNDAQTIDESKRLDQLVEAKVKDSRRSDWISFAVYVLFIVGAFAGYLITGDPKVFWSLVVPGASIVGNVVLNFYNDKNARGKDIEQKES